MTLKTANSRESSGFTLLEVLVALVILSLGLLGLAGLQLRSLQGSTDSFSRSQAMILAESISDRMRTNPQAVADGTYRIDPANLPATPAFDCEQTFPTGETTCDADELANVDSSAWVTTLTTPAVLPQGTGRITCNDADATDTLPCTENSLHTITVIWDEARTGATGTGCGANMQVDRQCLRIEFKL